MNEPKALPAERCARCARTLEEVGGRRIVATELIKLEPQLDEAGLRRWVCHECAHQTCSECGQPNLLPAAADVVEDDGTVLHCAYFSGAAGCINPECKRGKNVRSS